MWKRGDIKKRGLQRFRANYRFCVVVALWLALLINGETGLRLHKTRDFHLPSENQWAQEAGAMLDDVIDEVMNGNPITRYFGGIAEVDGHELSMSESLELLRQHFSPGPVTAEDAVINLFMGIGILTQALAIALRVFVSNPFEVNGCRFFSRNLKEKANFGELAFCFDHHYLNHVKTMFFRDLYNLLWCLLLFVPGVVKYYEYRMIPYILADHPEIDTKEAFVMSKRMMDGNKWDAFLLDLSFIGWEILNAFTFGVLSVFFLAPYRHQTKAALYEALKGPEEELVDSNYYVEVE